MNLRKLLVAALCLSAPSLALSQPIGSLTKETTFSNLFEVAIWDPSETDQFEATKRMALSLLLSGAGSALSVTDGTTTVADASTLTFSGATVADLGSGNVSLTIAAGGGSALSVTDGTTTVSDTSTLTFSGAATVTNPVTGDATVTISSSGLTANATSGLLISGSTIAISPSRLSRIDTNEVLARSDDIFFKNESDGNAPTLISVQDFLEDMAGDRLNVNSNNRQLDTQADYRGVAPITSTAYLTGEIIRQSSGSRIFSLYVGTGGNFTADQIVASDQWANFTSGTVPGKAYRGEPPLVLTQYFSGDIVEFSGGALYIYTGADAVEFSRASILLSSDWTQLDGITQAFADNRYVEVAGDTMTSTLTVTPATNAVALLLDARALTTQTPFVFNMNASGNLQAFWIRRGTDAQAFFTLDGNIGGGNANPGIALGPGGTTTRDVTLYRGGANALATQDAFTAKTLGLATGSIDSQTAAQRLATTQTNLGIISQVFADARYVELAGDTMTGTLGITPADDSVALLLNAANLTGQSPLVLNMPASGGNQQAVWIRRGTSETAWFTIDGNLGGVNANPGFAFGPGGGADRDVELYRGGNNLLETEDAFIAGTLGLATGIIHGQEISVRRIATQGNLGLNDACVDIAVAGTTLTCTQADGGSDTATLPSGGGGVNTFLALTDVTPTTYVDQARKIVAVNDAGTALGFRLLPELVHNAAPSSPSDTDRLILIDVDPAPAQRSTFPGRRQEPSCVTAL